MNRRAPVLSGSSRYPELAVLMAALIAVSNSAAETLRGSVVDPQQRVIAGAEVSLRCLGQAEVHHTDGRGEFSFNRESFPENCSISAIAPGFATLEHPVGRSRVQTLQLKLAQVNETISASAPPRPALASVSLTARELSDIPGDARDWVNYAEQIAGAPQGSDHIYVDGLPTDTLPPTASIERIIVNADPFSAEYSDGSNTHIDVITRNIERKLGFELGGFSFGPGTRNALNPHLGSTVDTGKGMLTGPVPYLPLAFVADSDFYQEADQEAIQAVVPLVPGSQITPAVMAPASTLNRSANLTAHYSGSETLSANASFHILGTNLSNMGVSGLTLPEAGMSKDLTARELRATVTKMGTGYVDRAGMLGSWSGTTLEANSSELGVTVLGAFIGGGADTEKETDASTRWTFKDVLEFSPRGHLFSLGITAARAAEGQSVTPNPFGRIQFDNLKDYFASATTGTASGTWFLTRGGGWAHFVSYSAAPFVEGELLRRTNFALRAGLRADYQTGGGALYSPRLAASEVARGFVLRAGTGMFVQNWPTYVFLQQILDDGHHLQQLLATDASLSDIQSGKLVPQCPIVSETAPDLIPAREWISKTSVERRFGNVTPGVEYTWTIGSHLLGSERVSAPVGWADILQSNRASRQHEIHVRAGYEIKGQSFTAHYEWIRARNNTDGPFSFPARQGDLLDEWAPASNISPHNVTIVAHFRIKATSLTLLENVRSAVPLNITSGLDPEGDGLYTDRGGRSRNSGTGPAYHSLALYAHHKFALPKLFSESTGKLCLDAGVHAENILNDRNYVTLDGVAGSPLFGRPLSALAGRSLRVSLGILPR